MEASTTAAPVSVNTAQQLRRLCRQLDSFGEGDRILGRFEMLGRQHRRHGGQGVVQFAEDKGGCEFAIKFFLDQASFLTEAALYVAAFPYLRSTASPQVAARVYVDSTTSMGNPSETVSVAEAVARFLPQVEAVCDGAVGGLEDPRGRPLPPCIVMERGESLHDWSDRAEPDLFTALAVLSNISLRLADMHDAGYVHRDLKPANVMWLPRQNRWTIIDFGCMVRIGENAPLSFTLAYAAPEVAAALQQQQRTIASTAALDAWSLGVMAYELLTGAPAFDLIAGGATQVMEMLLAMQPLPWEGELSTHAWQNLGALRQPVLQLLHRDSAHRGSPRSFHAACSAVFNSRTTIEC